MLEAGETNVSLGTLDRLARALAVDFVTLVAVRPVPALTPEAKEMILGDNARRVYGVADEVPVPAVADDWVGRAAAELVRAVSAAG